MTRVSEGCVNSLLALSFLFNNFAADSGIKSKSLKLCDIFDIGTPLYNLFLSLTKSAFRVLFV
jgi:hypothetical protein